MTCALVGVGPHGSCFGLSGAGILCDPETGAYAKVPPGATEALSFGIAGGPCFDSGVSFFVSPAPGETLKVWSWSESDCEGVQSLEAAVCTYPELVVVPEPQQWLFLLVGCIAIWGLYKIRRR